MEKDKENRQNVRSRVLSLVEYTVLPGNSPLVANIQNISCGGIAFLVDQEIKPGTALKLRFVIPNKKSSVEAQGEIVRCPQDKRNRSIFQAAVRFTDVSEETKAVILELEMILAARRKSSEK